MADKENGEDILRAILEKGSDKAKKAAADALTQHPPTPADPPEVKAKKRRKGLKKAIAAKIGNSKYYHDAATGAIVDEQGQPAPKRIAEQLVKEKVAPAASRKTQSIPELTRLKKELAGIGQLSSKTIDTNGQMINIASVAFEQFQNVLSNFSSQNANLLDAMVQQNADFHEKVIEAITGVKAPTKSSGSTKPSPIPKATPKRSKGAPKATPKAPTGSKYQRRVAAMTPAQKQANQERVQARAEHIGAIRARKTYAGMAVAGAAGAVVGTGVGIVANAIAGGPAQQPSQAPQQPPPQQPPPQGNQEPPPPSGAPQQVPQAPAGGAAGGGGIEAAARNMLAVHEGRRNTPYKDSKGLWTVGIGHLIGDGKSLPPSMNRTFSDAEVDELFSKDYKHHAAAAANIPGYNQINDMGKVALIDLTFNMGPIWYKKWPNFCKAMGEGNWQLASQCLEQSAWYGQVGRRAPTIVGLIRNGGSGGGTIGAPTGGTTAGAGAGAAGGITPPPAPVGGTERLGPEKRTALSAARAANEAAAAGAPTGGPPMLAPPTPGAGMAAGDKSGQNGMLPADRLASVGVGQHKAQPVAAEAFKAMRAAAAADKVDLGITDSYRSYAAQVDVKRRKPNLAATPGKSNHGWGLAFDMSFGSNMNTPGYKWMVQNAAKFGFKGPLQRPFEAWHWEYVGGGNPEAIKAGGEAVAAAPGAPAAAPGAAPTTAVQGAQMANASAERAIIQGTAPTGVQTVVMNNTRTINNTQIMHQPGSSLPCGCGSRRNEGFNPLAMVAGALAGRAVSRLF
jgi:GH24 family phage-related lysozyme (muramidase)